MKDRNSFEEKFKKEAIRLVLERVQGSYAEKRVDFLKHITETNPDDTEGIKEQLFVPFVNHDGTALTMDIFEPEGTGDKELPVVILVHGGGLVMGDNLGARRYARKICKHGCLVFSMEYRLAPRADVCQQLDDVCSGMDLVGRKLVDFNVDFSRIDMIAESAGAYLALYVAAMKKSQRLQEAIGYKASNVPVRALGLLSGMFYTDRDDPLGNLLSEQFYGEHPEKSDFMHFINPEHFEILNNLPPVFLVTSNGDVLNKYTFDYHKALKKAGIRTHLLYFGDEKLGHSFPFSDPDNAATEETTTKMFAWFEKVHKEIAEKKYQEPYKIYPNIEFYHDIIQNRNYGMPLYKFVREINKNNGKSTAIITEAAKYSYNQLFRSFERYAEVFTAMGITGKNGSRSCILYPDSIEAIQAFFGLNMVGTPVSFMTVLEIFDEELWMNTLNKEGITDLFIIDYLATPRLLRLLRSNKKRIGLRNIIILKNSLGPNAVSPAEQAVFDFNYEMIKNISGIQFMEELLVKYEATPIDYAEDTADMEAVTVHTSGTTKGIRKPIPFTNRQLNIAGARDLYERTEDNLEHCYTVGLCIDLSGSYGLISQLLCTMIDGARIVVNYLGGFDSEYHKVIKKYGIDCVETSGMMLDEWMKLKERPDLSGVKFICAGGSFISGEAKKRYNKFFEECGCKSKLIVGYGLSETAASVTGTNGEEDDSVGYPVNGVKLKIYDEETGIFHDLSEGPRIGGLYVSSDSLSCGSVMGEKYFDTTLIDGEEYLCTYDLVKVNENGSITICGRMNNYFVNNEGVKFNAGLIENSLEREYGITCCVIAPAYNKIIHDTVPVLFVETSAKADEHLTVKKALFNVFVKDGAYKETNLPVQVIILKDMPHNQTGKVDRYKLDVNAENVKRYSVEPVMVDEKLIDINLEKADKNSAMGSAIPDELKNANPLGSMDFGKLITSPELLKFMSPLVISAVLFGRVIPEDKKMKFGGCHGEN